MFSCFPQACLDIYDNDRIREPENLKGCIGGDLGKMIERYSNIISKELQIKREQVSNTIAMLKDGCTVPFIARYRKEQTGSLDEQSIIHIRDRTAELQELDKRKEGILSSLSRRELLTKELETAVMGASSMTLLEDLYMPFREKKRTKASIAREKGLERLASIILEQEEIDPEKRSLDFVDPERSVHSIQEALEGASHIIAEWINENRLARNRIRKVFVLRSQCTSKVLEGKEEEGIKFRDYFSFSQPARSCPPHRLLAILRGEREGILSVNFQPRKEDCLRELEKIFIKGSGKTSELLRTAIADSYQRLLAPAMERELRNALKAKADRQSISVFCKNLREILMEPPLGNRRILALDPGFRTGCKLVCLGEQGGLIHSDTIYPHPPRNQTQEAASKILKLVKEHQIQAIAVGNGTAGRETMDFILSLDLEGIILTMVNESGASIYSASDVAREEFPEEDITVRGTVSIGRRLMDPLAELVKLDPKSIGVGQYQHDVDQKMLKKGLDDIVEECVNRVGVDVNTASKHLLSYVSGLGTSLAENVVAYRREKGAFRKRRELMKVPRLGPKAFQQCAGFLRISNSEDPLDNTAVHPDSYPLVQNIAGDLGCSVIDLVGKTGLEKSLSLDRYLSGSTGLPTLRDILHELEKPGRDPRKTFEIPSFRKDLKDMEDLQTGMTVPGIVTNITDFGAFVDLGVHQDGLIHISHMSSKFLRHPSDLLSVGQHVEVVVTELDLQRRRISLSLKERKTR